MNVVVSILYLFIGVIIGYVFTVKSKPAPSQNTNKVEDDKTPKKCSKKDFPHFDAKMVLVARKDVKMDRSQIGAECGRATLETYHSASEIRPKLLHQWRTIAQAKIVCSAFSEQELLELYNAANADELPTGIVYSSDPTNSAQKIPTVIGIFGRNDEVNKITGKLKLFN
ncbi:putative peptidyl-tRNA hydrolase, PTH2 family [Monocercomonoides exilis]|uniref:putative peptidyl-tRNA hydrolase, PTH2 family n=1 Tax=Monocercomonoides exilis TaxID=2049356 RepID=UPI0035594890|nr:putative peptidyl-tRNA hydrolase, PTH2 family [Monocercomonoides exilis]